MNYTNYFNYLVQWLKDEVKKANMDGVIVGLSGGIDSSLVAAIAKKAFPDNMLGVIMPINSMEKDLDDIKQLTTKFNIPNITIDLKSTYETMIQNFDLSNKLAIANIKPRLRMTTLYALAQDKRYLVLGTDNLSEMFLGYFTKYGDGGVDLLPIVQLTKGEVRQMSREIGIPESIILKTPTAGLWDNQSDEAELGFSYDDFDQYIKDKTKLDSNIINLIERQHKITEHKRLPLPRPKKYSEI
ncbi:NAD(+) synthase [Mycoplasma procyoni]|uniref:NAD(+) synthase n=1 Tax=Mycoplasma procyoni TaxID=568784 RepID=UPI00197BCDC2|nr:NAD(+) synthase [Mycoplasma procyoni]MBN3534580.1 NAD(+) synthase [Mycoplasma procyoni]